MMPEIVKYDFQGHEVRIVQVDDREEWIASDVCEVLELRGNSPLSGLDDDEKGSCIVGTPGGPQELSTITEAGLYKLILRSRKPQAKAFSRWVTHEVLPSIRRTGSYLATTSSQAIDQAALTAAVTMGITTAFQSVVVRLNEQASAIAQLKDALTTRPLSDNCIGNRGAKIVSATLLEYAFLMSGGDKKKARSIRGMAEVTLRASLNYNGTGRIWSLFPASRWPELQAKLGELSRAGKKCGSQPPLPGAAYHAA